MPVANRYFRRLRRDQESECIAFDLPSNRSLTRALIHRHAEMAGTAVFLASPAAGYMNGQEIVIDGGYIAVNPARV